VNIKNSSSNSLNPHEIKISYNTHLQLSQIPQTIISPSMILIY